MYHPLMSHHHHHPNNSLLLLRSIIPSSYCSITTPSKAEEERERRASMWISSICVVDHLLPTWRMVTYDNDSPKPSLWCAFAAETIYSASSRGTQQILIDDERNTSFTFACFGGWFLMQESILNTVLQSIALQKGGLWVVYHKAVVVWDC